jgi:hypothetical protein
MGVLLAFRVTRRHPTSNAKHREERCHPLAADFPKHSRYTSRCWMRPRRVHAACGGSGEWCETPDAPCTFTPGSIAHFGRIVFEEVKSIHVTGWQR